MKLEKVKGAICSLKDKVNLKLVALPAAGTVAALSSTVTAFAADETTGGYTFPTVTITNEMLTPLVQGVVDNITAILPVGLGIFAVFLGIRIIPSLISRFARM
jgi:hypothetical protein